jgi:hypothetical protein
MMYKQPVHRASDDWHHPLCRECSLQNVEGAIVSCVPFTIAEHDLERSRRVVKPARTEIMLHVFQGPPILERMFDCVLREMNLAQFKCPRPAFLDGHRLFTDPAWSN